MKTLICFAVISLFSQLSLAGQSQLEFVKEADLRWEEIKDGVVSKSDPWSTVTTTRLFVSAEKMLDVLSQEKSLCSADAIAFVTDVKNTKNPGDRVLHITKSSVNGQHQLRIGMRTYDSFGPRFYMSLTSGKIIRVTETGRADCGALLE